MFLINLLITIIVGNLLALVNSLNRLLCKLINVTGHGKGGRNQEIALSAAEGIKGMSNAAVFSIGSDGTDGPTDAAGGYSDGDTAGVLKNKGIDIFEVLKNNDAYNALKLTEGLIITGPTGTNVNDVSVLLISD